MEFDTSNVTVWWRSLNCKFFSFVFVVVVVAGYLLMYIIKCKLQSPTSFPTFPLEIDDY